ncbi:MAG TPA: hypothetical protein VGS13_15590, partial [Stellaceae bacterium]|nr:hypothetical protein [Stellaceae bacterium]
MAAIELEHPMLSFGTLTDSQDEVGRRWISIPYGRYNGVEMVITPDPNDTAADLLAISWSGAVPVGFVRHFAALGVTLVGAVECEIWAEGAPPPKMFTADD